MRRTIATMGILGLALLGTAGTANAAPPGDTTEVHAGSAATPDSTHKVVVPRGENAGAENGARPGKADKDKGHWPGKGDKDKDKGHWPGKGDKDKCEEPEKPPVDKPEKPPVDKPEKPPVDRPEKPPVEKPVTPPAEQPVTPPAGAAQAPPAAVNVGFNVQTAAAGTVSAGIPLWLSVLTGLLTAGAATVLLRGLARGRNADS